MCCDEDENRIDGWVGKVMDFFLLFSGLSYGARGRPDRGWREMVMEGDRIREGESERVRESYGEQ